MRLVYKSTGKEVKVGDKDRDQIVVSIMQPHSPGSTGRVFLRYPDESDRNAHGYYPSVIGAEWVEREDQDE